MCVEENVWKWLLFLHIFILHKVLFYFDLLLFHSRYLSGWLLFFSVFVAHWNIFNIHVQMYNITRNTQFAWWNGKGWVIYIEKTDERSVRMVPEGMKWCKTGHKGDGWMKKENRVRIYDIGEITSLAVFLLQKNTYVHIIYTLTYSKKCGTLYAVCYGGGW